MKVLSLIQNLASGGGRVLVDVTRGLPSCEHYVLYATPIGELSFGLEDELESLHVLQEYIDNPRALDTKIDEIQPDLIFYHWWKGAPFGKTNHSMPWVLVVHSLMPAPKGYDQYVAVSDACYRIQSHISKDIKQVIYNGVDLEKFTPSFKKKDEYFTIGRASHLYPKKIRTDYVDFIHELDIPSVKALVLGAGPMKEVLIKKANILGMEDQFEFPGEIDSKSIPAWLQRFDVACHLTQIEESFCISVLECFAMGIPVISEPKGALPELISHNINGFMSFYADDLKRYCELIYQHPELRIRLSKGARETAIKFDIKIQQEAYKRLLSKLLVMV